MKLFSTGNHPHQAGGTYILTSSTVFAFLPAFLPEKQTVKYNDSEFCNGGKDPGLFMVSHRGTRKPTGSLPEKAPREKCPYLVFFWSVFSRISTKYREILCISPYSLQMRENTDQENTEYGHFSRGLSSGFFAVLTN